jgi:hypothetical protein
MSFLRLNSQRPSQHLTNGLDIHPRQFIGMNRQLPSLTRKPFVEQQLVGHHAKRVHIGGIRPAGTLYSLGGRVRAPHGKRNTHTLERAADTKTCHPSIGVGHKHIAGMKKSVLGAFSCTKVDSLCYPPDYPGHIARRGRPASPGHDVQRFPCDIFGCEIRGRPFESGPNGRSNC